MATYLRFDKFMLFPAERSVMCGDICLDIRGKEFDVLYLLAQRPKLIITKATFFDEIWKDVIVTETNLQVHISNLRKALGKHSDTKIIATVSKYGYEFLIEVIYEDTELTCEVSRKNGSENKAKKDCPQVASKPLLNKGQNQEGFGIASTTRRQLMIGVASMGVGGLMHSLLQPQMTSLPGGDIDTDIGSALQRKLSLDFSNNNNTLTAPLKHLNVAINRADFLRPELTQPSNGLDLANIAVPDINTRPHRELIKRSEKSPLTIDCMAIEPAVVASLLSVKEEYGVEIRISYSGRVGREQLQKLANGYNRPDIIVTAMAPMLLLSSVESLAHCYRLVIPLHYEEEYLMFSKELPDDKTPLQVSFYSQSACEEMVKVIRSQDLTTLMMTGSNLPKWAIQAIRRSTDRPLDDLDATISEYQSMEKGNIGIAWLPTSDTFIKQQEHVNVGIFRHPICLFARYDWLKSNSSYQLLKDFITVLRNEWMLCRHRPARVYDLLSKDAEFLQAFSTTIL